MLKNRLYLSLILVFSIILGLFLVYWFYLAKPAPFPSDESLLEEMNGLFSAAEARTIQDKITLDKKHVFVPFISADEDYGVSYWVWEKHSWSLASIDTTGEPHVWKLDPKDPSSYHFVWNFHPKDEIKKLHFYMVRERGYHITEGVHTYYPGVQMMENVTLEQSYGVKQMPPSWASVMDAHVAVEKGRQPNGPFNYTNSTFGFGWFPHDETGELIFPEHSVNGNGYHTGGQFIDYMSIMDKADLDYPIE